MDQKLLLELTDNNADKARELLQKLVKLGEVIKTEFADGMDWKDLLAISPRLLDCAQTVAKAYRFDEKQKRVLAVVLIEWLVDNTDGWGPDSVIDPVIKVAARAYLLV